MESLWLMCSSIPSNSKAVQWSFLPAHRQEKSRPEIREREREEEGGGDELTCSDWIFFQDTYSKAMHKLSHPIQIKLYICIPLVLEKLINTYIYNLNFTLLQAKEKRHLIE